MTVASIGLLFVANCTKGQSPTFNRYNFPEGTEFNEVENTVYFTVPEGYTVIGVTESEAFVNGGRDGSVRCVCKDGGGGCDPATALGKWSCNMVSCNLCKKRPSVKIADNYVEVLDMVVFEIDKVELTDDFSHLEGKVMLPGVFHSHPIVEKELKFVEENLIEFSNQEDRKIVFMNIGDYIVALDIPADTDNTSPYIGNGPGRKDYKCKCNVSGSCPKDSKLIATWCDSENCVDCTLSGIINDPKNGNTKSLTIEDDVIVLH